MKEPILTSSAKVPQEPFGLYNTDPSRNSIPSLKAGGSSNLLDPGTSTTSKLKASNRELALEYCDSLIKYYARNRSVNRYAYYISQASTIIFAGITPILILIPGIPPNIQAMPPIIAALSTSLSIFRWQENWVQCKNTEEDLDFEKLKFSLGITKAYATTDEKIAISNFLDGIHTLHKSHLREWTKSRIEQLKKEKIIKSEQIENLVEEKESLVEEKGALLEEKEKAEQKLSNIEDSNKSD